MIQNGALTIEDALFQQHFRRLFADFPPGSDTALWRFPAKFRELLVRVFQDISLLLFIKSGRVLVRVAMKSADCQWECPPPFNLHLVTRIANRCHLFWKRIETVSRDEPSRLDT